MTDYSEISDGSIPILGGRLIQYVSLMSGVYSVCQDPPSLPILGLSTAAYIVGFAMERWGHSNNAEDRFGKLERKLLEKK